jgi:hypothetical protein
MPNSLLVGIGLYFLRNLQGEFDNAKMNCWERKKSAEIRRKFAILNQESANAKK